jgi:hypothetical protein
VCTERFEVYAHALNGRPWTAAFRDTVITAWTAPVTEMLVKHGLATPPARRGSPSPSGAGCSWTCSPRVTGQASTTRPSCSPS